MDAFGQSLHQPRDADLVDHLGELAGAGGAKQLAHPRIGGDHRLGAAIGRLATAAHHGKDAVLGAGLTARHRGVDEMEAGSGRCLVEFTRDFGGGGGVVDEDRALFHPGEGAAVAKGDRAQVVVVADAGHHEILTLGGGLRSRGGASAEFVGPGFRGRRRAVVDRHLVLTLLHEMPRHGEAHDAETDESDFSHDGNLGC